MTDSPFDTKIPEPRTKAPKKSQEDVFAKLDEEWDFDNLISPYKQGGKQDMPVERTWGTMIDWLVNKRKFPVEIVGAAIFLVWMRIKKDGHFKPDLNNDGSPIYGSAGRKFAHAIAAVCAALMKNKIAGTIFTEMAGTIEDRIKVAFRNDMFILMPWFIKIFSIKYWKHRKQQRKLAKAK